MKKFCLGIFIFLSFLLVLGLAVNPMVSFLSKATITYEKLNWEKQSFVFENVHILSDSYACQCKKVIFSLNWKAPFQSTCRIQEPLIQVQSLPHITPNAFLQAPHQSTYVIPNWLFIENGKIQYLDFDPLEFSVGKEGSKNLNLFQNLVGWQFKFHEIPIQWMHPFFPTLSSATGVFSGFLEVSSDFKVQSFEITSDWIDCNINNIHFSGASFLKWGPKDRIFAVEKGSFKGEGVAIENIDISLGPNAWNLGKTKGSWDYLNESILIEWENLGPVEVMLFKNIFFPSQDFRMNRGDLQGKLKIFSFDYLDISLIELHGNFLEFEKNGKIVTGDLHWKEECGKFQGQYNDLPVFVSFIQLGPEICFDGNLGDFKWDGLCGYKKGQFYGQIPNFSGKLPSIGFIRSKEKGFQFAGSDYQLEASLKELNYSMFKNFECDFYADSSGIDLLNIKGMVEISIPSKQIEIPLYSPRVHLEKDNGYFDIRLQGNGLDFGRVVGKKEKTHIYVDEKKSHFWGAPLFFSEVHVKDLTLDNLKLSFQMPNSFLAHLNLSNWNLDLEDFLAVNCSYSSKNLFQFSIEGKKNQIHSQIKIDPKGFLIQKLEANLNEKLKVEIDGFLSKKFHGDFQIHKIGMESSFFPNSKGSIQGSGVLSFNSKGIESDMTVFLKNLSVADIEIENKESIRFFYSSSDGILLKNIDCFFQKEKGYVQLDYIQFDPISQIWSFPRAHISFKEINTTIDIQAFKNLSEWTFQLNDGFINYKTISRHVKDLIATITCEKLTVSGFFEHGGHWIGVDSVIDRLKEKGTIHLKDSFEKPEEKMEIQFKYGDRFDIESILGKVIGIDAKFYRADQNLVGEAGIDFKILSKFIPKDISEVFSDLEMGKGFTIKGTFLLDPIQFNGILIGKDFELFGNEFRTLFSNISMSSSHVLIQNLKVSDKAACFDVDRIFLQGSSLHPWTIEIPTFKVTHLRPSLLHKPNQVAGDLSPLLVKELLITDFQGILDDSSSYQAKGTLSFLNTFRREKTVFDLPSNFFSRFIGIDLELLIPVEGEFSFSLLNQMFYISHLQNVFSEARRSQFFLPTEKLAAMDLDGNLHIELKMKHFVLFALTEGFTISITGKLNRPSFGLVKGGSSKD